MKSHSKCMSFKPEICDKSEVLILGSMPGVKSIERQEYYAHPQNRFWKVVGNLIACENLHKFDYEKRIKIILDNGFALWDVMYTCLRNGSLDTAIFDEVPNNIPELLKKYHGIKQICFNGNKSFDVFKKHFPYIINDNKVGIIKLPSTSPANAKYDMAQLVKEWSKIIN